MITMSRLFRHALQKPWPETSACRDPMSFVAMPRAVGAHARPDDLTRWRLERRGEPCYPLGAGGGPPCFYSYLPPPHPLRIFQNVFSGDLLIEIFSEVSVQLQRRVRPPSPDGSPDRQRAPVPSVCPHGRTPGARAVERMGGCSKLFPRNDGASSLPDVA